MNTEELAKEITQLIIDNLNITYVTADEVDIHTPLFSDENPLSLDSIDAIEIVVQLKKNYGIRITDEMPAREILYSIQSIVDFLINEKATVKVS